MWSYLHTCVLETIISEIIVITKILWALIAIRRAVLLVSLGGTKFRAKRRLQYPYPQAATTIQLQ